MSRYVEIHQLVSLRSEIHEWVVKSGKRKSNTPARLIKNAQNEVWELQQSVAETQGDLRDPRVLEEIADPPIYLLLCLQERELSLIIHYVEKEMSKSRKSTHQLVESFSNDLNTHRGPHAIARTIASVFCFALKNGSDPIELASIKHEFNLFRYPAEELLHAFDREETRKRLKRREKREDMKKTMLFPRLSQSRQLPAVA